MSEAIGLVVEDQGDASLLANTEREFRPSGPRQPLALEPPGPSMAQAPPYNNDVVDGPMPAPNTSTWAAASWPDALEELVNNSVIVDGHRTLMSVVM